MHTWHRNKVKLLSNSEITELKSLVPDFQSRFLVAKLPLHVQSPAPNVLTLQKQPGCAVGGPCVPTLHITGSSSP